MNEIEKTIEDKREETPSRSETFSETLSSMFTTGSTAGTVFVFALSIASLGWLADSVLPLLSDLSLLTRAWFSGEEAKTNFAESFWKLIVPLLWFLIWLLILFAIRRAKTKPRIYETTVPKPHAGLIVMLSRYSVLRGKEEFAYQNPAEIETAATDETLDLDRIFSGCNWGQMAFVVRYHAPLLRHCWIVTTRDGTSQNFPQAAALLKFLTKEFREIRCEEIVINNHNDIGETALAVGKIYKDLKKGEYNLRDSEVISDFTGGTSAMSGGMVLATLDEGKDIEYVKQGIELSSEIMPQKIRQENLIVSPKTSYGFLSRLE